MRVYTWLDGKSSVFVLAASPSEIKARYGVKLADIEQCYDTKHCNMATNVPQVERWSGMGKDAKLVYEKWEKK